MMSGSTCARTLFLLLRLLFVNREGERHLAGPPPCWPAAWPLGGSTRSAADVREQLDALVASSCDDVATSRVVGLDGERPFPGGFRSSYDFGTLVLPLPRLVVYAAEKRLSRERPIRRAAAAPAEQVGGERGLDRLQSFSRMQLLSSSAATVAEGVTSQTPGRFSHGALHEVFPSCAPNWTSSRISSLKASVADVMSSAPTIRYRLTTLPSGAPEQAPASDRAPDLTRYPPGAGLRQRGKPRRAPALRRAPAAPGSCANLRSSVLSLGCCRVGPGKSPSGPEPSAVPAASVFTSTAPYWRETRASPSFGVGTVRR